MLDCDDDKLMGRIMELQNIRIMLVEDNPVDVAFTRRLLSHNKLNKDLIIALNSREAFSILESLDTQSRLPDLILLDINLPDASGIDLLRKFKDDLRFRDIAVVILTRSNVDDDIQRSYDLGAKTYLVKPISNQALKGVLEQLF
ncbi:MAG: response regulator [Methanotrichaceae archaeon]|nr:response regulator [Methanotrichaceae archaeon]